MTFRFEKDLAAPVARFLRNRGFNMQMEEAQFYEYSIDILAHSKADDLTASVELKLTKWSRAIEQAVLYQLCSNLVYVAMPGAVIRRVNLAVLRTHGVGLLAVAPERCREVLAPVMSNVVRRHYRESLLLDMRSKRNAVASA